MNCPQFHELSDEALSGSLPAGQQQAWEEHRSTCPACAGAFAEWQRLRASVAALPRDIEPGRDLWPAIAAGLEPAAAVTLSSAVPFPRWRRVIVLTAAAAVVAVGFFWMQRTGGPAWTIDVVAGAPRIGSRPIADRSPWRVGQWLETDAVSRARLAVGSIGEVDLGPDSRLRFLQASATDHRIELARGSMSALIWAPPRLFFVETPSATAIDLGCAYTLDIGEGGTGALHVTSGYVALRHHGRESIIPAGMMCLTKPDTPPGTPFPAGAPEGWRRALERFDFEEGGSAALGEVLGDSRFADPVTLWHMLGRCRQTDRAAVYDALVASHPPPRGVDRDAILAGNPADLARWAEELGLSSFLPVDAGR